MGAVSPSMLIAVLVCVCVFIVNNVYHTEVENVLNECYQRLMSTFGQSSLSAIVGNSFYSTKSTIQQTTQPTIDQHYIDIAIKMINEQNYR